MTRPPGGDEPPPASFSFMRGRPRGGNVHGHGPCTQDVGTSAPYAEVTPCVLSVRPAAARMEMPSGREGEGALAIKDEAEGGLATSPSPRHLPRPFSPFKLLFGKSHILFGISSNHPIIPNEDHARKMDLEYQRPQ